MKLKLLYALMAVALCTASGNARPKPCTAYVSVSEQDALTSGLKTVGLNKPQLHWYRKHGNKGEYSGVCVLGASERAPLGFPVYVISWSEHLVSGGLHFVDGTGGTKRYYVARGTVSVWRQSADNGQGGFVKVGWVNSTNRTILTSPSASLLKNGLLWIAAQDGTVRKGKRRKKRDDALAARVVPN